MDNIELDYIEENISDFSLEEIGELEDDLEDEVILLEGRL